KPSTLQDRCAGAFSHDWFIRDDDRRARRERVVNLVRKLRIDPQARRDLVGIDAAAAARHGHPLARLAARSQGALSTGSACEQRVNTIAKRSTATDLKRGAANRLTIAIDIDRFVGGANYHRDRPARAALRIPVVLVLRERAYHRGCEILRRK